MYQFKRKVSLELSPHATENDFDLDTVADHHPQQVVAISSLRQAGGGQVELVIYLTITTNILDILILIGLFNWIEWQTF